MSLSIAQVNIQKRAETVRMRAVKSTDPDNKQPLNFHALSEEMQVDYALAITSIDNFWKKCDSYDGHVSFAMDVTEYIQQQGRQLETNTDTINKMTRALEDLGVHTHREKTPNGTILIKATGSKAQKVINAAYNYIRDYSLDISEKYNRRSESLLAASMQLFFQYHHDKRNYIEERIRQKAYMLPEDSGKSCIQEYSHPSQKEPSGEKTRITGSNLKSYKPSLE